MDGRRPVQQVTESGLQADSQRAEDPERGLLRVGNRVPDPQLETESDLSCVVGMDYKPPVGHFRLGQRAQSCREKPRSHG